MKVVALGRQRGKTTQMLQWLREAPKGEHRVIVSPTKEEAMRLLRENPDLASWQFVTIEETRSSYNAWSGVLHGRGGRIVLGIDNLDLGVVATHLLAGRSCLDYEGGLGRAEVGAGVAVGSRRAPHSDLPSTPA